LFYASLLAHELAHSLVARRYGLKVKSITLWLLGGISELGGDAPRPSAEAWIAGVGPLTSLLLGGIIIGLAALAGTGHPARASIPGVIFTALAYLGVSNVVLAVFNVIPAAPLDGGRLLRAVVWWRTGDKVKATVWASRSGQVFGWICVVGGLYAFFLTRDLSWVWFSLIGWFVVGSATAEAQQAVLAGRLRGIRASQVMTPDPVTVPGSMTVSGFVEDYLFRARHQSFPVTGNGGDTVTGLVTLDRIKHVPAGKRDRTRLADVACPLADVATASPEDSVADILPRLTGCADRRARVQRRAPGRDHHAQRHHPDDRPSWLPPVPVTAGRLWTVRISNTGNTNPQGDSKPESKRQMPYAAAYENTTAAPRLWHPGDQDPDVAGATSLHGRPRRGSR
jgi:Zn-dependent protease/CBS domain-containing protein